MNTDLFTLLAGSMAAGALMFVVVAVPLVLLAAKKKQWQAAEELKQITAATRAYIEDLEQRHAFAPVRFSRAITLNARMPALVQERF